MNSIRELLAIKGDQILSIKPDATVLEALKLMAEHNIGSVLVMEQDKLVGIFSERDYARKVRLKGRASEDMTVGESMTKEVIYVSPDDRVKECMALMTNKRCRHLPVIDDGQLVGVISIGDLVKQIIADQEVTIHELEKYITGGY